MNSEKIILNNKEYYISSDNLKNIAFLKLFLFEDSELQKVAKNFDGRTLLVNKKDIVETLFKT